MPNLEDKIWPEVESQRVGFVLDRVALRRDGSLKSWLVSGRQHRAFHRPFKYPNRSDRVATRGSDSWYDGRLISRAVSKLKCYDCIHVGGDTFPFSNLDREGA